MHDFLIEARDEGLIQFITDNGGGGLSSSIGESARFSNGCVVELEKVPLKYEGLDQWEIWVSESQERMTVAIRPEDFDRFMNFSKKHAVESTVIGTYTDSGKLIIKYNSTTCAFVDMDFLESGFPQWEFEAEWRPPIDRGLYEPVIGVPMDFNTMLLDMLSRPNICSKEWIVRQYDHEVQGGSVIKPLVGVERDVYSDATLIRPVLSSTRGLAFAQSMLPMYSAIDAYHMTSCTIDEAVRRIIAIGGDPEHIGGVDNFCWPSIQYHPEANPDGKFKAAQLVRSCQALYDMSLDYGVPLLSGKDSMYVDGHLPDRYNLRHKVSALESLQFSTVGVVENIEQCVTMDAKFPDDLIYILGQTKNELGGSEYYDLLGYIGKNVPVVDSDHSFSLYKMLSKAIGKGLVASAHGIYRGGVGVHLAMIAMAGNLGVTVDLNKIPTDVQFRNDKVLFSESAGRFIVTIQPSDRQVFEDMLKGHVFANIGRVTDSKNLEIYDGKPDPLISVSISAMKKNWKKPFGELI